VAPAPGMRDVMAPVRVPAEFDAAANFQSA
jgi:hypothetical protein